MESKVCALCNMQELDAVNYGTMVHDRKFKLSCHTYCMYFSSALAQDEPDSDHFSGFVPQAVLNEVKRGRKLRCNFCSKPGATIGCCVIGCSKKYHYFCGKNHGALFEHFGTYRSLCQKHRPPPPKIEDLTDSLCLICQNDVDVDKEEYLTPLCCKRSVVFHYNCLQTYAYHSGNYHFKCPHCSNVDTFKSDMLDHGISLPERDASWELDANAFEELRRQPVSCSYRRCRCPNGRDHDEDDGVSEWDIVTCDTCGYVGRHFGCIFPRSWQWTCNDCQLVVYNMKQKHRHECGGVEESPGKALQQLPMETTNCVSTFNR